MGVCLNYLGNNRYEVSAQPLPGANGDCLAADEAVAMTKAENIEYVMLKNGSPAGLTSADALYSFSWGFGAVMFFWAMGFGVRAALKAIKLI